MQDICISAIRRDYYPTETRTRPLFDKDERSSSFHNRSMQDIMYDEQIHQLDIDFDQIINLLTRMHTLLSFT